MPKLSYLATSLLFGALWGTPGIQGWPGHKAPQNWLETPVYGPERTSKGSWAPRNLPHDNFHWAVLGLKRGSAADWTGRKIFCTDRILHGQDLNGPDFAQTGFCTDRILHGPDLLVAKQSTGRHDGRTDGRSDGRTDGRTDGRRSRADGRFLVNTSRPSS